MARLLKKNDTSYVPTPDEQKAMSYCLKEGIKIYPEPLDNAGSRCFLVLSIPGKQAKRGDVVYDTRYFGWYQKIYEMYLKIYEKNYGKEN